MKKWFVGIALILIILLASGFLWGKHVGTAIQIQKNTITKAISPTPIQYKELATVKIDTAGWKTYHDPIL